MTQVAPFVDDISNARESRRGRLGTFVGFAYLALTVGLSIYALVGMERSTMNDYYWPDFNASGIQTFLADVYNQQLPYVYNGSLATLELNRSMAMYKDYSRSTTAIDTNPSRARSLLLTNISLLQVVVALRNTSFSSKLWLMTPHCWVDFNRSFELAHTDARQQRCITHDLHNGAVYFEALVRNSYHMDMVRSQAYSAVNYSIFTAVGATVPGQEWLQRTLNATWLPVADEITSWQAVGISSWQTQLENDIQRGIQDTITIENALGLLTTVQINNVDYTVMGNKWTTAKAFAGIYSETFWCYVYYECSLVRGASNHFDALGINWDTEMYIGVRRNPPTNLVRQCIGPFGSIDIRFVPVPFTLLAQVQKFWSELSTALQTTRPSMLALFNQWHVVDVDIVPPLWQNDLLFYGGNPMCLYGEAKSYVQPSFGFYDACGSQDIHTVTLTRDGLLFALTLMSGLQHISVSSMCSLCTTTQTSCISTMEQARTLYTSLQGTTQPLVSHVWDDVASLNISVMQFATQNATEILLRQAMVVSEFDPWTAFGWVTMYEWAQGKREVFMFEGDVGSVTTISPSHPYDALAANPLSVPRSACSYIWYIIVYVTFVLLVIGAALFVSGAMAKFNVTGASLFHYSRVVGSVWIGRPMLLVRGMTAIVILSTANVVFISRHGFAQLEQQPRSIVAIFLLAFESTWLNHVIIDICLPLMLSHAHVYAPWSSFVACLAILVLESMSPFVATITISPTCVIERLDRQIECQCGSVRAGSWERLGLLCIVQLVSVLLAYTIACLFSRCRRRRQSSQNTTYHHLLVPISTQAYLCTQHDNDDSTLTLGNVECIMSGMLPLGRHVFDVKIWTFVELHRRQSATFAFQKTTLRHRVIAISDGRFVPTRGYALMRLRALAGLGYIVSTVVGSYLYLNLTQSTMANDLWWDSFNSTGSQSFLSNWFTIYLQLTNAMAPTQIDMPMYGNYVASYDSQTSYIVAPTLYAAGIQNEVNYLENIVTGLRNMDSCLAPWIFSAYCFVDFNRQWEMANSANRQLRCMNDNSNGAVYLESILRNVDWATLNSCWGASLEIGVYSYLRSTNSGQGWLSEVQRRSISTTDEINYWVAKNITMYTTQWQAFKRLGVIETFSIRNAYGLLYPFTIKQSNGSFVATSQFSLKLYWGFGNDLLEITTNSSSISGKSFIRTSSNFAFENASLENILSNYALVNSPPGPEMALLRSTLFGPFGSIDVIRIATPKSLLLLYQTLAELIEQILFSSELSQFNGIPYYVGYSPQPTAWNIGLMKGGNIFCEFGTQSENSVSEFFTVDGSCNALTSNSVSGTLRSQIRAILAAKLLDKSAINSNAICQLETSDPDQCLLILSSLRSYLLQINISLSTTLVQTTKTEIRDTLNIQFVQFILDGTVYSLSSLNVFDPNEAAFEFFSWLYIFEWVEGSREVVSIQGAYGTLTTLSGYVQSQLQHANPLEIPFNVAYYIRCAIYYVTMLLLLVGSSAIICALSTRGYNEGWNMMEINRVAGVIWIGRPLILLRGITAICLLSTVQLQLIQSRNGLTNYFTSPPKYWFTVGISCGEVTWLVYIINDLFSPFTGAYTTLYGYKSSNVMWISSFVLTLIAPVQHRASISRSCTVDSVDFQVVCQSGTLEIGSSQRFFTLIGLAFASCGFTFAIERLRHPNLKFRHELTSLFLHAIAKHNFSFYEWHHGGMFYLDKASAVLNGLLSVHVGTVLYVFDIKSWRGYAFDTADLLSGSTNPALSRAIPLVE
ncbi:Aste57867_7699 [Aphanomyces stellatus]|uniref:Aste57867_7699 protein n=1 Tax=Aphanomyces stellatus TaxID=120398 RepID=A0A485KIP0_9STRA|nr:hypothetical protein As57867_007670 [Aphanomyces stellatus]VFT84602.1 Aste57867_7699 [Aphanomyces stellatus]